MGLTKQYLKFTPAGVFGVVANKNCNAVFLKSKNYRFCATGATNGVSILDTKFQKLVNIPFSYCFVFGFISYSTAKDCFLFSEKDFTCPISRCLFKTQ